MIDYCSTNRIFTFVVALIGFSVITFFIEEYTEESNSDEMKISMAKIDKERHTLDHVTHSTSDCWINEPIVVIQSCVPCTEFEVNAMKTKHCLPTGYFDRLNCTTSNIQALRPCSDIAIARQKNFHIFCLSNVVLLLISYTIALKRKETLDRFAYMRVAQQFDD